MKIWKTWEFDCSKQELERELNAMQKCGQKIESISSCIVSDWGRRYQGIVVYTEEDAAEG